MKIVWNYINDNYKFFIFNSVIFVIIALYIMFPSMWRSITILGLISLTACIILLDFFQLYNFGTKYVPDTNSSKFNVNKKWPPIDNKCPDFFSETNDPNIDCVLKNDQLKNTLNDNTCFNYIEEDAIKNKIVTRENEKPENKSKSQISNDDIEKRADGNYYNVTSNNQYSISSSEILCAKQIWAENCNLSWDGVTNLSHC